MKYNRFLAIFLSVSLLFGFNSGNKAKAVDPVAATAATGGIVASISAVFSIGGVLQTAVRWVIDGGGKVRKVCANNQAVVIK